MKKPKQKYKDDARTVHILAKRIRELEREKIMLYGDIHRIRKVLQPFAIAASSLPDPSDGPYSHKINSLHTDITGQDLVNAATILIRLNKMVETW